MRTGGPGADDRSRWRWLACALLALTWLTPTLPAKAAAPRFQHFGTADGLPQQQVLSLHQDRLGYLWVGSYSGLGRYNGREFRVFSTADGLASNSIQSFASSAEGELWVGTTRGLCRLLPAPERFDCTQPLPLASASVQALAMHGSSVLVGTPQGLFQLQPGASDEVPPTLRTLIADLNVVSLASAEDGGLWVGTQGGLLHWSALTGQYASVHLPLSQAPAVTALLGEGGRLWIGSSGGLLVMHKQQVSRPAGLPEDAVDMPISGLALGRDGSLWATGNRGVLRALDGRFELLGADKELANPVNHSVLADREGAVWIGSDGGLSRHLRGSFEAYSERDGLIGDFVRTLEQDAEGRLWLGTRQGVQVVGFSQGRWRFDQARRIGREHGLVDERIYDIAFPSPGRALIATAHGLVDWREGRGVVRIFEERDGLPSSPTRALHVESPDRVWVGTTAGIALLENDQLRPAADPLLAQARTLVIEADGRGRLWFGTLNHGLLRMDPDGRVQRLGRNEGISDEVVWDIAVDAADGVWAGTNGDGLLHIATDGSITRYDRERGMPDAFVWSVLATSDRGVWAYTNRGLVQLQGDAMRHYSEFDGLLHPEGAATGALLAANGDLWFAGAYGLVRYAPEQNDARPPSPFTVIESARAGASGVSPGARLPAGTRELSLQFAAPQLRSTQDLRYRYRLLGSDAQWSQPMPYRPITFASLAAGDYRFEVQARLGEGEWGPAAALPFSIEPSPWQRPWVQAAMAGSILLVVGALVYWRLHRGRMRRRQLEREVEQRTRALAEANARLEQASLSDPLTGLANRRYLARQITADLAQCRRAYRNPNAGTQRDLVFLMVDIDHFKQINDRHGHAAGDAVLQRFALTLQELIRESDYAVRWGGEEFLVVARDADGRQAAAMAERIVTHVRDQRFPLEPGVAPLQCTCSVGVAVFPFLPGDPDALEWEQVVKLADAAAYLAKRRGRDGWVEISAAESLTNADLPELLEAVRRDIEEAADRSLVRLRGRRGVVCV
jgi:diguanylate cyclase (GGDEF)-like protein